MSTDVDFEVARREVAAERAKERRERIATAALTGLLAWPGYKDDEDPGLEPRRMVRSCVEYADALIEELDREK